MAQFFGPNLNFLHGKGKPTNLPAPPGKATSLLRKVQLLVL